MTKSIKLATIKMFGDENPESICGSGKPPDFECLARIPLPSVLTFEAVVFLSCSIFVLLINALLVVYVLSKVPKRKNHKKKMKNPKKAIFKLQTASTAVSSVIKSVRDSLNSAYNSTANSSVRNSSVRNSSVRDSSVRNSGVRSSGVRSSAASSSAVNSSARSSAR